jgi:predicted dehydrogenase
MKKLGIGVVGCGHISEWHVQDFLADGRVKVVATCDLIREVAEEKTRDWGAKRTYTDYRDLIKDPEVDVVCIYTRPLSQHGEITIAAAEAGKHVSCQKPITISIREADEVVRTMRRTGIKYQYAEPEVWIPTVIRVKELIEAGEIGERRSVHLIPAFPPVVREEDLQEIWERRQRSGELRDHFRKRRIQLEQLSKEYHVLREQEDVEKYRSSMTWVDHAVHWMSVVYYWMGEIEKVGAFMTYGEWNEALDYHGCIPRTLMWKHAKENRYGVYVGAHWDMSIRWGIIGIKGMLYMNRLWGGENSITIFKEGKRKDLDAPDSSFPMPQPNAPPFQMSGMAKNLIDSILEDKEPRLNAEDGRHLLAFALAACKSAKEDKTILLSELT